MVKQSLLNKYGFCSLGFALALKSFHFIVMIFVRLCISLYQFFLLTCFTFTCERLLGLEEISNRLFNLLLTVIKVISLV